MNGIHLTHAHVSWPLLAALAVLALALAACGPARVGPPGTPEVFAVSAVPAGATMTPPVTLWSPPTKAYWPRTPTASPTPTPCHGVCPTPTTTPTPRPRPPTSTAVPRAKPIYGTGTALPGVLAPIPQSAGTLALLARFGEGEEPVFSPGNTLLLTMNHESRIARVYRVRDGTLVLTREADDATFSPNGKRLITLSSCGNRCGTSRFWRLSDGHLMHEVDSHYELSSDGTLLAVSANDWGNLQVYRMEEGGASDRLLFNVEGYSAAFSPDSALLAVMARSGEKEVVRLYRTSDGSLLFEAAATGDPLFSPGGSLLAVAYRIPEEEESHPRSGAGLYRLFPGMRFTQPGDCGEGSICIWRVADGGLVSVVQGNAPAAFSPDGTWFVTYSFPDDTVYVYRVADGRPMFQAQGYWPEFSPDGASMALEDSRKVKLYRVNDGVLLIEVDSTDYIFSPDGSLVMVDTRDGASAYRTRDGSLAFEVEGYVGAFSPGGLFAATVAGYEPRYTVRVYRLSDGSLILDVAGDDPRFSPDGTLLAIAAPGGIELWGLAP